MPGSLYGLYPVISLFDYTHRQHWRNEKGYDLYPVLRLLLPQVSLTF